MLSKASTCAWLLWSFQRPFQGHEGAAEVRETSGSSTRRDRNEMRWHVHLIHPAAPCPGQSCQAEALQTLPQSAQSGHSGLSGGIRVVECIGEECMMCGSAMPQDRT